MEDNKETTGGDLDVNTLMGLLKDKAKELKSTQKKLSKVEDKYVEMRQ
jgi:chromosome segregation ATPase